jgi:hypothetical protein
MKEELIARWDAFLQKMETRFEESLEQGQQAVLDSLDDNDFDYFTSVRTLMAIRSRIDASLIRKIDDTWQQQVEPLMRADGHYWAEESHKGYHTSDTMHERMSLWQYITEGRLAEKYYGHAIGLINRNFFCTQCNAPLQVKHDFFMAQYVPCSYCNTVNTFEPETRYVTIGWNVVDSMAALYALQEYKDMLAARSAGAAVYEQAVRKYYERYFDERIKLMPHTVATREQDIERKIRQTI